MTDQAYLQLCRVAGDVSRETFNRLVEFEAEFRRWNARINLTAPSTLPTIWSRHILDSAQLLPLSKDARHWTDLGSGGGFPGAIVAILMAPVKDASVTLVESNRKKAAFLQTTLSRLGVPVRVIADRIDNAWTSVSLTEIVTARALAPLDDLLELASPALLGGARALFHKGRDYQSELMKSRVVWKFDLVEHRSQINDDGVVLEISGLARRHD